MKEREPLIVGGLVALLLAVWLGFLAHTSPRFAGSLWGGVLGVAGGLLLLASFAYMAVKRVPALKEAATRHVSMATLLSWHIYAGLLGALLGLLHTGHKFQSPLGIALTALMLLVVLSGFVGRYLLKQVALEVSEKMELLARLELAYRHVAGEAAGPQQAALLRPWRGLLPRLGAELLGLLGGDAWLPPADDASLPPAARALRLAESIADVEYAIQSHETFKWWFAAWLAFHIVTGIALCALLGLHVWAAIHFGLRWFS